MQALDKSYRYATGYAYIDNVNALIQRIDIDLGKEPNAEMQAVRDRIEQKAIEFREDWIAPCYQALYDWEKGEISPEECARRINLIIS